MGVVIKDSIKSTVISLTGAVLGFLYMVFAIKYLDKVELGFQQSLIKNVVFFSFFSIFGLEFVINVFGQRYTVENGKRGAFLLYTIKVITITALIIISTLIIIKPWYLGRLSENDYYYFNRYFWLIPMAIVNHTIYLWLSSFVRSINKATFAFFSQEVMVRLIMIANLLLFAMDAYSFSVFIIIFSLNYLLPTLYLLRIALQSKSFVLKTDLRLTTREKQSLLWFAFYQLIGTIGIQIFFQIDSVLFPILIKDGLEQNAIYGLGIYIASIVRLPLRVLGTIAIPTITNHYDQGDAPKIRELYLRSAVNLQAIALLISVLWIANLDSIIHILSIWKPGYDTLAPVSIILLIGVVIEMGLGISFELISISKYARANFWIALVSILLIIVLSITLIKAYGIIGAAWAFTIGLTFFSLLKIIFLYKKMDIVPLSKDSLKLIGLSLVLMLVVYWIPSVGNDFLDIAIKSIIVVILFIFVAVKWNIGEDISNIAKKIMSKLPLRL